MYHYLNLVLTPGKKRNEMLYKHAQLPEHHFGISIYQLILFQVVSGHLGHGVNVLSPVDMESNMELGVKSDLQEMVVDVMDLVGEVQNVFLKDLVEEVLLPKPCFNPQKEGRRCYGNMYNFGSKMS